MRVKLAQISTLNIRTETNIYISHHHIKRSIVESLGLRVKRICSEKEAFLKHMREMKIWLLKQGFHDNIVDQELGKVEFYESS